MLSSLKSYLEKFYSGSLENKLRTSIKNIVGLSPSNMDLYTLAISHTSAAKEAGDGSRHSNERLEYLGDAVLGIIVAEYLFKKFPFKNEGFLTEIRSRIVNRESLNTLGRKIGLDKIIVYVGQKNGGHKSIHGDALEALIGAVYMDKGFYKCKKFVLHRLLLPHFDLDEIIGNNKNFKSILIEWVQKENKKIRFHIIKEFGATHTKEFTAQVTIDDKEISTGLGHTKKKAEQAAAEQACREFNLS